VLFLFLPKRLFSNNTKSIRKVVLYYSFAYFHYLRRLILY